MSKEIEEMENERIQRERDEIAQTIADNYGYMDEKYDASDFEWAALQVQNKGYRKQVEGEWIRKDGFFVCSNCDGTKPFAVINDNIHYFGCPYCNKCGAYMKGADNEQRAD